MADERPDLVAHEIVRQVTRARIERGLSVNKLAWMSGVSPSAIAFIENNTHSPTLKTFLRLSAALELDAGKILADAERHAAEQLR